MKKVLSLFLSFVIMLSVFTQTQFTLFAQVSSGQCGENLTWVYDFEKKELHISGSGKMWNYRASDKWYPRDEYGQETGYDKKEPEYKALGYSSVIIDEGVESIGDASFYSLYLTSMKIPSSVEEIGFHAVQSGETGKLKVYFDGEVCDISENSFFDNCGTTTEAATFNGTFYCSKTSDAYNYAVLNYIDYHLPESECTHSMQWYGNSIREAFYCPECNSFMCFKDEIKDYAKSISAVEEQTIRIENEGTCVYLLFTPETDGEYILSSESEDAPYVLIYDADMKPLTDGIIGGNFSLFYSFKANQTYVMEFGFESCNTGSFNVKLVENPVASIEFTPVKPYEFIENTKGSFQVDDETGEKFYEYNWQFNKGDLLTVVDKNGERTEYRYSWDRYFRSADGDEIELDSYSNQWSEHWTLGSDNYFTVSYAGKEVRVPVTIVESPVESIEYKLAKPIEIYKNERVTFETLNVGDILTVNYKDGTKKEYKHTEYQYFFDSDDNEIEADNLSYETGDDYFTISYLGKIVQVPVTVISVNNAISKTEYIPVKKQYAENMSGRYKDGYYKYNLGFKQGDKLNFEFANGEKESYTYIVDNDKEGFYSDKTEKIIPFYAQFTNNFSKNPWKVGTNTVDISIYDKDDGYKGEKISSAKAEIEVIGVKNIEFHLKDNEPYVLYEGVDCWFNDLYDYNHYDTNWIINEKLDYAIVTLSNGKQEKLKLQPYASEGELTNDDYSMEIFLGNIKKEDGQSDNHWGLGNHTIKYTYGDYKFEISAKVVENPVASIEFKPLKPYILVENKDGYMDYDWETGEEYFYYEVPEFVDGDVLIVNNKDGSKVEYTAKTAFNEDLNDTNCDFYDSNGKRLPKYVYTESNQSLQTPWTNGSNNYLSVIYMGVTTTVPVAIVKEGEVHIHSYTQTVTAPTCTEKGYTTYTCECGDTYKDNWTTATGHTEVIDKAVPATCTKTGLTEGSHCSVCDEVIKTQETVAKLSHNYDKGKVTKSATCTANGVKTYTCTVCKTTKTETIKALGHRYTTKIVKPTYTSTGYTLHTCTRCKKSYKDKKTKKLVLKNTSLTKLTAGKKAFTAKWKKQSAATGYQIQYSTSSKFKSAKTVTVSKNKTTSKKVSKLKAKKKYYVRIRTYKTVKVNGKNTKVYSSWSKAKTVKTK